MTDNALLNRDGHLSPLGAELFLAEELSEESLKAICSHLTGCEPCRAEMARMRTFEANFEYQPSDEVLAAALTSQENKSEDQSTAEVLPLRRTGGARSWLVRATTSLAAAAAVLFIVIRNDGGSPTELNPSLHSAPSGDDSNEHASPPAVGSPDLRRKGSDFEFSVFVHDGDRAPPGGRSRGGASR